MLFLWIFLPLVLAAYYLSPRKIRNGILVFFSLLFYAWGEPIYILLMLCSVLVNFNGGILWKTIRPIEGNSVGNGSDQSWPSGIF